MGCGSSRRLRAVTPIQPPAKDSMVLPVAWMQSDHKKPPPVQPVSANAAAQTDVQADVDLFATPIMGWDTRDVETQTPDYATPDVDGYGWLRTV